VKINQAISDVSAKPCGGVLFFPAGFYLSGTVMVKSGVKIYVIRRVDSVDTRAFYRAGLCIRLPVQQERGFGRSTVRQLLLRERRWAYLYRWRPNQLTNFVFENCTFHKTTKPSLLMGKNVAAVTFKNVRMNGVAIKSAEQLQKAGVDLSVPVKFTP
jgi:hypothetical protein